jgi:type IV pilus assembly protein PilQ
MMNAQMNSWLAAGCIVFVGGQADIAIGGAVPAESMNSRRPMVAAAILEATADMALVSIQVPGFQGRPAIQVLSNGRLVVDLPGVERGKKVPREEVAKLKGHPFIRGARMAQFEPEPAPVTRLVLELAPSVKAVVSTEPHGVDIALTKGAGRIQASLLENSFLAPASARPNVEPSVYADARMADSPTERQGSQLVLDLPPLLNADAYEGEFPLNSGSAVEKLPQIGSPYVGLPSLSSIPIMPLAAAQVQSYASSVTPRYPSASEAKELISREPQYTGEKMKLNVANSDLSTIVTIIAKNAGLSLVMDPEANSSGWRYNFDDVPWDQILDEVLNMAGMASRTENGVLRVAKAEKFKKEADDRKAMDDAMALAGELVSESRSLSYAKVEEVKNILEQIRSDRGKIIIDQRTGTIILKDLPKYVADMQSLLNRLDVKVPQVQIAVRIVEATRGWEKGFGVSWPQQDTQNARLQVGGQSVPWGAQNGPSWNSINSRSRGGSSTTVAFSPGITGQTSIVAPAGEVWVSFLTGRMSLNAIIQAMEENHQVKIVSEPKLISQNNYKATISDDARIPYQSTQGGMSAGAISTNFEEVGLNLQVMPRITNEGTIILDVDITKGSADFVNSINGNPTLLRKKLTTQVLVEDGGTAILGGVFTNTAGTGGKGVPLLSKLPGLGWLFRSKTSTDETTEMLVMISPTIINK